MSALLPRPAPPSISPADFERMIETGVIREGERVELLNGSLVTRTAGSPAHEVAIER